MKTKTLLNRLIQAGVCCLLCGEEYGKQRSLPSTWYEAKCDICKRKTRVTEPRNFEYLRKGQKQLQEQLKKEERKKKKEKKLKSSTYLREKADEVFSIFIRQRDADIVGNVKCCTCGKISHWKQGMQCGHWIHRNVLSTRYDESNCHSQCVGCNMFGGGKEHKHELYIIERHGKEERDRLLELSKVMQPDFDYQAIINKYS